jgi:hypothetical protein
LDFFTSMHIPILAGRSFSSTDLAIAAATNATEKARRAAAAKTNTVSPSTPTSASPTALEMVRVDEPSGESPIRTSVVVGNFQYQAWEMIRVAGRRWQANRLELRVALPRHS